eukprot:753370-Hanusia_phi.AAC.16
MLPVLSTRNLRAEGGERRREEGVEVGMESGVSGMESRTSEEEMCRGCFKIFYEGTMACSNDFCHVTLSPRMKRVDLRSSLFAS